MSDQQQKSVLRASSPKSFRIAYEICTGLKFVTKKEEVIEAFVAVSKGELSKEEARVSDKEIIAYKDLLETLNGRHDAAHLLLLAIIENREESDSYKSKLDHLERGLQKLNSTLLYFLNHSPQSIAIAELERIKQEEARERARIEMEKIQEAKFKESLDKALSRFEGANPKLNFNSIKMDVELLVERIRSPWKPGIYGIKSPSDFISSVFELILFRPLLSFLLPIKFVILTKEGERLVFVVINKGFNLFNVQLIQKSSGAFVEKELFGSTGVSSILGVVRRMNDYLTESKVLVNSVEVEINKNYRFDLEFIFSYLFSEIRKQELIPIFFAYPEYFGVSRTCSGCPRELTNWISAVIYERGPVCGNHNYKLPKYEEREEIIDKIIEKLEYKLTRQEDLLFYCDGYFMSERVKKLRENFTGPGSNILYPRISIELFRSNKEQFLEGLRNWREYSYEEMYDSLDNIIEQNFS